MRNRILPTILLMTILVMCLSGCVNRPYSGVPDENLTEVTEDNFTILAMPTSSRSVSNTHYKYSLWHGDMIPVSTEKTITDYYVIAKHRSGYCCRFQLDELDWRAYQVGNQIPLQVIQKYDVVGNLPHNPYVAYNGKKLVDFKKLSEKEARIYEENFAEILAEETEQEDDSEYVEQEEIETTYISEEEQLEMMEKVDKDLRKFTLSMKEESEEVRKENAEKILNELVKQGLVKEFQYVESSKLFTFTYANGVMGGLRISDFEDGMNGVDGILDD